MPGRVGVLISGRGTNLQALLDASQAGLLGGDIVLVISNQPEAAGLDRARRASIATRVVSHAGKRREDFDRELVQALLDARVDLVCLAGFMRRLSAEFVAAFRGRLLNVHPSLLPAFPGLEAQRQALEHGVKVAGATVHFVDDGLDSGPIVLQEAVPVLEGDSVDSLSARILAAEHRLYPAAVRLLLEGRCRLEGRRVHISEAA
jgi:phosphoribosylglycinamide formyltransferase-1